MCRLRRHTYSRTSESNATTIANTAKEGFSGEMTGDFEEELPEPESTVFEMTTKEIESLASKVLPITTYAVLAGKKLR